MLLCWSCEEICRQPDQLQFTVATHLSSCALVVPSRVLGLRCLSVLIEIWNFVFILKILRILVTFSMTVTLHLIHITSTHAIIILRFGGLRSSLHKHLRPTSRSFQLGDLLLFLSRQDW